MGTVGAVASHFADDTAGKWFGGFANLMLNGRLDGARQMAFAIGSVEIPGGEEAELALDGINAARETMDVSRVVEGAEGVEAVGAGSETLYRGVTEGHPYYEDAIKGSAVPRGTVRDPIMHNLGETGDSAYTSWTRDPRVAEGFARRSGRGVVLSKQFPASAMTQSLDRYLEDEILIEGIVHRARVRLIP